MQEDTRFTKLNLAKNLQLPYTIITKRIAILARVGGGKSYTADVFGEEVTDFILKYMDIDKGKIVYLDPQGIHYTLREKFPLFVIGGKHGDIPLDLDRPRKMAQMVHDLNLSIILDFKGERKIAMQAFAGDFLDELYFLTRDPTMIILEEGDIFAPQSTFSSPEAKASLDAVDSIVRRARGDGMGCVIISQRAAKVNKDILTQVDLSIFHNVTGERDLKVIREMLSSTGASKETIRKYIAKIMSFDPGKALIVSPNYLKETKEIQVRERITTHGGETREFGHPKKEVKLIPMKKEVLISYMDGEVTVSSMELNTEPRKNKWTGDAENIVETKKVKLGTTEALILGFVMAIGAYLLLF